MPFGAAVAGGLAACDIRAAFQLLKLLLCCCLVAGVLKWCSSGAARWVVAATVVFGLRVLAAQLDVRKRLARPPCHISSRHSATAAAAAIESESLSRNSSAKHRPSSKPSRQRRDHGAWRNHVGSDMVAAAWDKLCNNIIQEFIYDTWFGQLSPDREFPAEVRWQLNHAFGQASRRARRLDWTSLLIRDCSAALGSTLQLYRTAADLLGPETLRTLPAPDADAAIRSVLSREHLLHPAFSKPDGQYLACKHLSEAVLVHVVPPEDRTCPMLWALMRELLATCLLRSTLASLAPYSINKLLLNILPGGANQRVINGGVACAAGEFEQKGDRSSTAEQEFIGQQKGEHRPRRSLLGAANLTQEDLARARRAFKSSVKRSKSHGDVKEAAGSRSPHRGAAVAANAAVWPSGSLAMAKTFSRWRDSPNSSPLRSSASSTQSGQLAPQALLGSMGAVKAAAQQLSLRRRPGTEARLGSGTAGMAAVTGSSSPSLAAGADSPSSCVRVVEHSSSPDRSTGYRVAAAAARAMSTGGFTTACSSSEGNSSGMFRSTAFASSGSSSSVRSPMAALCGLSKSSWSASDSQPAAAAAVASLLVQPHGKMRAQVVSADVLNLDGKECVVYKVHVADVRGEWTVTRRYRHFEALHKRLRDHPHYKDLPASLPPKRLLTARDTPFVVRRRDELDCYLQALLHSSLLRMHPALQQFLDQQSELYSMAAAADELQGVRPLGAVDVLAQRSGVDDAGGLNSWQAIGGSSEPSQQVGSAGCCSSSGSWQPSAQGGGRVFGSSLGSSSAGGSNTIGGCPSFKLPAGSQAGTRPSSPAAHTHLLQDRQVLADEGAGTWTGVGQELPMPGSSNQHPSSEQLIMTQQQTALLEGQALPSQQQQACSMDMTAQALQQLPNNAAATNQPMRSNISSSSSSASNSAGLDFTTAGRQQDGAAQTPQQARLGQLRQMQAVDSVDTSFCEQQALAVPQLPRTPPVPNKVVQEHALAGKGAACSQTPGTSRQLSTHESVAARAAQQVAERQHWSASKQLPQGPLAAKGSTPRSTAVAAVLRAPSPVPSRSTSMPVSSSHLRMEPAAAAAAAVREAAVNPGGVLGMISSMPPASGVLEAEQLRPARSARSTALASTLDDGAMLAAAGRLDTGGIEPPKQRLSQAQDVAANMPALAQGAVSQGWQDAQHQAAHGCAAGAVSEVQALQVPQQGSSFTCNDSDEVRSYAYASEQAGGPPGTGSSQQWLAATASWQEYGQDSTGLIGPLYELVSCAFELQSKGFVRRPIITLVRQLLSLVAGDAIDDYLQKALAAGLSEESISTQITRLQAQLWPGGVWFASAAAAAAGSAAPKGAPITAERYLDWAPPADCDEVAEQVRQQLLASNVPAPLLALLGKNAYFKCMADIHGVIQSKTLMYNLGLTLVETVLVAMFPEIRGTVQAMHQTIDG